MTQPMPRNLLMSSNGPQQPDPELAAIKARLERLSTSNSVVLMKPDQSHLRADGVKHKYTIVFYRNADAAPVLVGRAFGSVERGQSVLQGQRVLVTHLEYWSTDDGLGVLWRFACGDELAKTYTLRDPATSYTDEEIRDLITHRSGLPTIAALENHDEGVP